VRKEYCYDGSIITSGHDCLFDWIFKGLGIGRKFLVVTKKGRGLAYAEMGEAKEESEDDLEIEEIIIIFSTPIRDVSMKHKTTC
jgi:hypothetical protein